MKPSRVLSVAPIFDSEPQCVHVEVLCSVCGESDALALNLDHPGDLSWLRRFDFYFVCDAIAMSDSIRSAHATAEVQSRAGSGCASIDANTFRGPKRAAVRNARL